ncbi:MAG: retroviral-like aspartic protease [Anaerolineales bacterium]|nr:retroviral-like aspartic protease [Anaerolineales bacterium]
MIAYDTSHDPPAIILPVVLSGVVHERPRHELSALIDTGADITSVPAELADTLKLYPFGRLQLEDANAVTTLVFTYEVRLSFPNQPAKAIEAVLTPYPFVILGRDWLQDYYLFLD